MNKILKELLSYILIILIIILIRSFVVTPIRVRGVSMVPTLYDKQLLLLNKISKNYKRFSIVVFDYEQDRLIKRIIGLPGEHIKYKNNILYINGVETTEKVNLNTEDFDIKELGYDVVPEGHYFVVGDNRTNSLDSRKIGFISEKDIIGTAFFSFFPFDKFGTIK